VFCFNNFLFYSAADALGDLIFHVNSLSCLNNTGYCVSGKSCLCSQLTFSFAHVSIYGYLLKIT